MKSFDGRPVIRKDPPEPAGSPRAWAITFMLFGSMTLNFVDRLVLANVAPALRSELHLSNIQYSYIVFGFMTGMTLGQLPVGMIVDWLGARLGLPGLLAGWSAANMLHALARGVASFSSLRFIMGLFECGNYSSAVKTVGGFLPARQRALGLAIMDSGSLLGSIIAPPLAIFILTHFGWRAAFFIPSVLGLLWIAPWLRIYRPEMEPGASQGPERGGEGTPTLRQLLKRPETCGLILMRGFGGPVSQFYWYWLPLYLVRGRGMSLETMAALSSLSFLIGGSGNMIGGLLSGWMIRRGSSVNTARKLTFLMGSIFAAASALVPIVPSLRVSIALVALAIFGLNFTSCNLIAIITDLFPETALARVTGLTGVGEGVMNMALTLATGIVVDRFSYTPVFLGAGVMPLVSMAALLLLVGPIRRITLSQGGARAA